MDELLKPEQFKYKGFDSLFCCLGSQTKHGEETFVKVDKTYPLKAADIALQNSIFVLKYRHTSLSSCVINRS